MAGELRIRVVRLRTIDSHDLTVKFFETDETWTKPEILQSQVGRQKK